MASRLNQLLDHYDSPKILSGPHATSAGAARRAELQADEAYQELRQRLAAAGCFAPARWPYAWRMAVLLGGYVALVGYLMQGPAPAGRLGACLALGVVHTLCNFLGHDLSHGAVSKRRGATEVAGQVFNSLLTGFSFRYFRRSHTLHHYHCNEEGRDPDTLSALWSVNAHGVRKKRGAGRAITRMQHLVIPFLYVLWAFALKAQGLAYALRNPRKAAPDLAMLALHFGGWAWLGSATIGLGAAALDYALMTAVVGVYLGVIFPVSHVGAASLPAARADTCSFLEQQLLTTRNVTSTPARDALFMGLNSQIEHHLFPWMPSMRLAAARPVVRRFCQERGLPYEERGHVEATLLVMRHLAALAASARADEAAARAEAAAAAVLPTRRS
jgi:fatty acid desaturase